MTQNNKTISILRIDASARKESSVTRELGDSLIEALSTETDTSPNVTNLDLADTNLPFIDEEWIGANFTPEEDRTSTQQEKLAFSDALISDLEAADIISIGLPVYNFSIPASLKAWIDLISRARKTFRYTENGPEGLLKGKKAYILLASGGTKAGSEIDFATPYLKHALKFVGIEDVEVIAADAQGARGADALAEAKAAIVDLAA